ncbi:MAG TPA: hypothetical protein VF657_10000 [Actinoplanes sp.]|jgi:hypothetical protein
MRVDRRSKLILAVAAVAGVAVNAGVAWAYWTITGSGTGTAVAGTAIELTLSGRSDAERPLFPGATSDLTVTVTNDNDFPIRITSVTAGAGRTVADDRHAAGGCRNTGVVVSKHVHPVSWDVAENNTGVFTVPDGIRMTNDSDTACQGAVFTIPLTATGVSAAS